MWLKGWMPYEECYRVPLIVRWPGHIAPGSRSARLVQTHDLAHTYVAASGAKPLPYPDGRALQPLFEDEPPADLESAYRALGGQMLWNKMRELQIALHHRGVRLSVVDPENIKAQATAAYLEIKRRQLL